MGRRRTEEEVAEMIRRQATEYAKAWEREHGRSFVIDDPVMLDDLQEIILRDSETTVRNRKGRARDSGR